MRARVIEIINLEKHNPPHKAVNSEVRSGGPLKWVRWQVGTATDPDLLDLPPGERWVWPFLLGDAAGRVPRGRTPVTNSQIARAIQLTEEQVAHAIRHLRRRKIIRFVTPEVAA